MLSMKFKAAVLSHWSQTVSSRMDCCHLLSCPKFYNCLTLKFLICVSVFRACTALVYFLLSPITLASPLLSSSTAPPLRGVWCAARVPCAALPAVRWEMNHGRMTAGYIAVPHDQQSLAVLCLTATVAANWDTDRLFWSEIPASLCQNKQTNTTLWKKDK